MTLQLKTFISGPLENNVILLFDNVSKKAVVIDPSLDNHQMVDFLHQNKLEIESIWITHAHFDHFAGISRLVADLPEKPKIGFHKNDLDLWLDGGGSNQFGFHIEPPGDPDFFFEEGQKLEFCGIPIEVRLAPGHSLGSIIFFIPDLKVAVCGDVIFYHGIGRTDLKGGSYSILLKSIREQVFTLPQDTRLITGHGIDTTVMEEMLNNPFLN